MSLALNGYDATTLYQENDAEAVPITLRLGRADRTTPEDLKRLHVRSETGALIASGDLVNVTARVQDEAIYRKNQLRVVYVTADVAGRLESPVYSILDIRDRLSSVRLPAGYRLNELYTSQPTSEEDFSLKWDGEWHITYEVFRDLGAAFAVALLFIYMLIAGWFEDLKVPFILMVAIPLSLVGILVGHWLLGAFFTATSMIGMIALAGIMVRNSVLLMDFIKLRLEEGVALRQAVVEAGAVRTMPILLTAGTVVIGAFVILFDPIFEGLAISLMGGSLVSTALTLLIVPLVYFMMYADPEEKRRSASEVASSNGDESPGPTLPEDPATIAPPGAAGS
jgi:multidrug efflux pump subunit AcrB